MSLFQNFMSSLTSGVSQQMKPATTTPVAVAPSPAATPVAKPVTPAVKAPITTSASPAAVSPALKTPAAQAYVASQTPKISNIDNTNHTYQADGQSYALDPATGRYALASSIQGNQQANPASNPVTTPTTGAGVEPVAPAPSAMDNYINAYKKYIDTQTNNTDVANAKTAYNDFVAEQAKSVAGKEGRGLGIPLQIVRGEQERLKNQTDPEAARLQNAVGIAQDSQTNAVNGAKSTADFFKTMFESEQEASKPLIVDGVAYSKQADGSYKALTTKDQNPTEKYGTGAIGEYNFAKANGYEGTFSQYQNEDANRKKSIAAAGVAGSGLTPNQVNSTVNQIAGAFDNEPLVKEYNTIKRSIDIYNSLGDSATDDIQRVYTFAKVADPNSAVKEGEYSSIEKYSQALLQRAGLKVNRVFNATGILTPEARQAMSKTLNSSLKASESAYKNVHDEYQRQIQDAYSGKGRTITDYAGGNAAPAKSGGNDFSDVENSLQIDQAAKVAYIPRAVWSTLGARMDALLADVAADGYTLKIKD